MKKNDMKKLSIKELQQQLIELEGTKMKLELDMRSKNGSSMLVRNYPPAREKKGGYGNVNNLTKDIARIKTFLHVKMQRV